MNVPDLRSREERIYVRALTRYERRERAWGLTRVAVTDPDSLSPFHLLAALALREQYRPLVKQARDLVARLEAKRD